MARYTANLCLPVVACHAGPHGVTAALSQALLASGLDLEQATRLQVAASASSGDPWPLSFRLVISWTATLPSAQASDLSLDVLSREPMATREPSTRAVFEEVLTALQQQLAGVRGGAALPQGPVPARYGRGLNPTKLGPGVPCREAQGLSSPVDLLHSLCN